MGDSLRRSYTSSPRVIASLVLLISPLSDMIRCRLRHALSPTSFPAWFSRAHTRSCSPLRRPPFAVLVVLRDHSLKSTSQTHEPRTQRRNRACVRLAIIIDREIYASIETGHPIRRNGREQCCQLQGPPHSTLRLGPRDNSRPRAGCRRSRLRRHLSYLRLTLGLLSGGATAMLQPRSGDYHDAMSPWLLTEPAIAIENTRRRAQCHISPVRLEICCPCRTSTSPAPTIAFDFSQDDKPHP